MFGAVTLAVAAILAATSMLAGHYVAPRLAGRDLRRLEAYAWGCMLGVWLPFAGWCLFWWSFYEATMVAWLPGVALGVVMIGAGLGTLAGWGLDALLGLRADRALRNGQ